MSAEEIKDPYIFLLVASSELGKLVSKKIKDGYIPFGSPIVVGAHSNNTIVYIGQAMVLRNYYNTSELP